MSHGGERKRSSLYTTTHQDAYHFKNAAKFSRLWRINGHAAGIQGEEHGLFVAVLVIADIVRKPAFHAAALIVVGSERLFMPPAAYRTASQRHRQAKMP